MAESRDLDSALSSVARSLPPAYPVAPTPGRISFAYGLCAPESFRPAELAECARKVLEQAAHRALQYGPSQGSRALLQRVSAFLRSRGLPVDQENIVITTGSMQALELAAQLLLDPGDVALVEGPTFMGALEIFRKLRAKVVAVPVDADGILPDELEATAESLLKQGLQPKLLYTIPTFQNPSGVTAAPFRREKVLEVAHGYGMYILEDDAYREIWFYSPPPPSYFSQAPDRVLYLGTFSKVLAPGLRLGWLAAPPYLVSKVLALKRDAGSSPFVAELVAAFMAEYDFEGHLEGLRRVYRERAEAVQRAARRFLGSTVGWREPEGGFFLWMETPVLDLALVEAMANQGVEAVPGSQCFPDGRPTKCLRIAYSSVPLDQIEEGMRRIGLALETLAR